MECKIDHTADGAIPISICRVCNPAFALLARFEPALGIPAEKFVADLSPEATVRYERKLKRRLRAEVKAWRERIEAMERSRIDPRDIKKAKETLRKAETDLYMVA
jgi:hypothetical protein